MAIIKRLLFRCHEAQHNKSLLNLMLWYTVNDCNCTTYFYLRKLAAKEWMPSMIAYGFGLVGALLTLKT